MVISCMLCIDMLHMPKLHNNTSHMFSDVMDHHLIYSSSSSFISKRSTSSQDVCPDIKSLHNPWTLPIQVASQSVTESRYSTNFDTLHTRLSGSQPCSPDTDWCRNDTNEIQYSFNRIILSSFTQMAMFMNDQERKLEVGERLIQTLQTDMEIKNEKLNERG